MLVERTEFSILEYPFSTHKVGNITWQGKIVGFFTPDAVVIYERLPADVLFPILKDCAEMIRERTLPSKRGFKAKSGRTIIFAIPDAGYIKLLQLTVMALAGDVVSLNILKAMKEGDNEKDPEHEKLLMLVLGTMLGGFFQPPEKIKERGKQNQQDTENFLKIVKKG